MRCVNVHAAAFRTQFTNVFLTLEEGRAALSALRAAGTLAFDQVPLVEIDGLALVQGTATANYLGRRFGLLPTDPVLAHTVERLWVSSQDARAPLVSLPFASYPSPVSATDFERVRKELDGPKGLLGRYAPKWEAALGGGDGAGPYFLGRTPSIADLGVFEVLDYFCDVYGAAEYEAALAPYARLRALVHAVRSLGRLAEHCDVERTRYDTWDGEKHANWPKYAKAVRTTLA